MKKLIGRFASLTAVLLLVLAVAGCSAKVKSAYHLKRADGYYKTGQLDQAEIEYINTLHTDPENSRAYARLGVIYYDEGRLPRAAFFLAKASSMATNDLDLRLKLGLIDSASGKFKEARDNANFILDHQPLDDEAPLLLAEAASPAKEAVAVRQRLQALMRNGDRASLEVAMGNLALRENDLKTAEAAFLKAQTLDPKSAAVNVGLAALDLSRNDLKSADAHFKMATEVSPARSPRRMQYARFKMQTGDLVGARQVLEEIVKPAPDYIPALQALAEVSAAEKKYAESADWLAKAQARDPDNFEAMLFSGQLARMRGEPAQAVDGLERMIKVYPKAALAHYRLAQAYLANNDATKSMNSLVRALDIDTNFVDAILLMAQIQIKTGNANPAVVSLERLRQKQPNLAQAQLLLADGYRLQNRDNDALAIYQSLEKSFPQNPEIPLLKGSAFLQLKDYASARTSFERSLALAPDNGLVLEQMVNLDLMDKKPAAAMDLLNAAVEKDPKQVALRLLLAKVYLAQGNQAQTEAALQKAIELDPADQRSYLFLAQFYLETKQNQKALAKLDDAIAKDPKDISALMLAGMINETDRQNAKAAEFYEKLLLVNPKYSAALNNLAYLYSEYLGKPDRAYELAQQARELAPNDPSTADTLGWICLKKGLYPTALGLLQEGSAKLPANPDIQFHLGMAYYLTADEASARAAFQHANQNEADQIAAARAAGLAAPDFTGSNECQSCLSILAIKAETADAAARALLEKRISNMPSDPVALSRLAAIYQREGNTDKAISAYKSIHQVVPNNIPAIISLARLYADQDRPQAYELAKTAYKLAPNNPEVAYALGRLAYLSGDGRLAVNLLQQLIQNQPDNPALLFDYAQAAFSVGRIPEAQAALQNASAHNLAAPQSVEAQRLLEMMGLAAAPASAVAASARVADVLKAEPDYVPALFAQAVIDAQNGDALAAEKICEKILDHYPDFAPAQKQLALLYSADPAKLNQAYDLAVKARDTLPTDPVLAKTLGIILVQRGEFGRAVNLLKEAAPSLDSDPELFFYLGKAHFQLKNRIDSKAALQKAVTLKLSGTLADAARQMLAQLK